VRQRALNSRSVAESNNCLRTCTATKSNFRQKHPYSIFLLFKPTSSVLLSISEQLVTLLELRLPGILLCTAGKPLINYCTRPCRYRVMYRKKLLAVGEVNQIPIQSNYPIDPANTVLSQIISSSPNLPLRTSCKQYQQTLVRLFYSQYIYCARPTTTSGNRRCNRSGTHREPVAVLSRTMQPRWSG
jgi:hypothetical protein